MASLASSGGADTPERPEPGFRARSRRRRRSSSGPSPTTFATSSEGSHVFAVDKPAGKTSHDVVAHVRRILQGAKVGHAGTLDPGATGVLVLCVGRATKISSFLMESEKEYRGSGRLGVTTDTQDASGAVIETRDVAVSAEQVVDAATRFVGRIDQTPPMYSAVKVSGKRLYRLARAGVEVDRPARPVEVYSFELSEVEPPSFSFEIRCSKGTYVRTMIHDLGAGLGCGGHLERLTRTRQAGFGLSDCVPWEELEEPRAADVIRDRSVRPEQALDFLPAHEMSPSAAPLRVGSLLDGATGAGSVRVVLPTGRVLGVGRVQEDQVRVLYRFPTSESYGRRIRTS